MAIAVPPPLRFIPRPISDRAWWDRVAHEPAWADWRRQILAWAADAPVPPARLDATGYLQVRRANDRSGHDRHTAVARRQLAALAVRRCLHGEADDDLLLDTLWAQLTEPTWCHAAHLGTDLPRLGSPVLDLMACEQAAFFAELIELLGPWLERQSPSLVPSIVAQVDRLVLEPFGSGMELVWDRDAPGINNWTGVCGGSLLAACESFAAQGRPRPVARARALECVRRYVVNAFTPDGECDEGIGYWIYGMVFAVLGLSRLDPREWPALERLRRVADYPRRCHLTGDTFISGNDSGMVSTAPLSTVPWLARGLQDGWLWAWARRSAHGGTRHLGHMLREADALGWLPTADAEAPPAAAAIYLPDQQVGVLRAGPLVAALAGGHNAEQHNHNDLGQLLVAVGERFILPDLGSPHPYPADFFSGRRYEYLAASSRGHSVPVIGGHAQRAGREAAGRLLAWQADGESPHLELDLTTAYPAEAGLDLWIRRLERVGPAFVMTDHYRCRTATVIEHVLWSCASFAGNGLAIDVAPEAPCSDDRVDPADHHLEERFPQPLHRRSWRFACTPGGELVVQTRIGLPIGS